MEVGPAYGRDYKSQAQVKADWKAGKDFQILDVGPDMGRMVSKAEADEAGFNVIIRYARMTRVVQA
jgi:hypothetical protein